MVNGIKGKVIKAEYFFRSGNSHPLTQLYCRWYRHLVAYSRAVCLLVYEQVMSLFLQDADFPIESSVLEEEGVSEHSNLYEVISMSLYDTINTRLVLIIFVYKC